MCFDITAQKSYWMGEDEVDIVLIAEKFECSVLT